MCSEALAKTPHTWCTFVHEPVSTDVDESYGVCPDIEKHPGTASTASVNGGVRTLGPGNEWYREQQRLAAEEGEE